MNKTQLGLFAALLCLAAPAAADDFFVDAVNGDDANDGLTRATAFRTLTRASQAAQPTEAPGDRVLVASGRYDASIGEVFPIAFGPYVQVIGAGVEAGVRPVVAPHPLEDAFELLPGPFGPRIEKLSVDGGRRGFHVRGRAFLSQVEVRGCSVAFDLENDFLDIATIWYCAVEDCPVGVHMQAGATSVVATSIVGAQLGVLYEPEAFGSLTLRSSQIQQCGKGIEVRDASVPSNLVLESAVITDCATGIDLRSTPGAEVRLFVNRGTLAGNGVAVSIDAPLDMANSLVRRSIIASNGVGFATTASLPEVRSSIVEDGSAIGHQVVAVAAGFVDAANGDYSLERSSFAVDRFPGDPETSAFEVDGNLDGRGGDDLGALERRTMRALTSASIGGSVTLEAEGERGTVGIGLLDRSQLGEPPALTPYGALFLSGTGVERAALVAFPAQEDRATWSVAIPNDPALVGTVWSAQTLVRSQAAPLGAALTNEVRIVIE